MGKLGKALIALFIVAMVFGMGMIGYFLYARNAGNQYIVESAAVFNAATMVNATETYTDPARAVIAEYRGKRVVVSPDNYAALVTLLRKECTMPLFASSHGDDELVITVCDDAVFYVRRDRDSNNHVLVHFEDSNRSYTMHLYGGNLYNQLLNICTVGSTRYKNIPLEDA